MTTQHHWQEAHWLTGGPRLQVRARDDGDFDVRSLLPDEFGRMRWTKAKRCPAAYWRAEGCTCGRR